LGCFFIEKYVLLSTKKGIHFSLGRKDKTRKGDGFFGRSCKRPDGRTEL